MLGRREQGGEKAIPVGRAYQRLAMGKRVLHETTIAGRPPAPNSSERSAAVSSKDIPNNNCYDGWRGVIV